VHIKQKNIRMTKSIGSLKECRYSPTLSTTSASQYSRVALEKPVTVRDRLRCLVNREMPKNQRRIGRDSMGQNAHKSRQVSALDKKAGLVDLRT
jgi:hypothetical protein